MDVCPVLLRSYTVPCCNACEGVVAPSSSPLQIHPPSLELLYHPPSTPTPTWGWALYLAILKAFGFHTWGSVTRLSVVQPFDHFSLVTPIDCSAHPVNVSIFFFFFLKKNSSWGFSKHPNIWLPEISSYGVKFWCLANVSIQKGDIWRD